MQYAIRQSLKFPAFHYHYSMFSPALFRPSIEKEDDLVSVGKKLLQQYFRTWPSDAAGHSAGEILSDYDIDDLIKSMP